MEFFRQCDTWLDVGSLQQRLPIAALADCCASIDRVISVEGDSGEIYCLWGQFRVNREKIRDGLRFTLPGCPNALAWTLTLQREEGGNALIRVHCTINQQSHDPDFIESIELFVDDWQAGLGALA
jgi:hypothetical protein